MMEVLIFLAFGAGYVFWRRLLKPKQEPMSPCYSFTADVLRQEAPIATPTISYPVQQFLRDRRNTLADAYRLRLQECKTKEDRKLAKAEFDDHWMAVVSLAEAQFGQYKTHDALCREDLN